MAVEKAAMARPQALQNFCAERRRCDGMCEVNQLEAENIYKYAPMYTSLL